MLAFVTSLRHPQNSAQYGRVEELLCETLKSVTNQTCSDYVVIVVGNQRPSFALPERVHFVLVDFPAPAPPTGPMTARTPFVWDKGTKIGIGLVAAREFSPDYVMIFDADDFVHQDLAAFTRDSPGQSGWVVEEGWMYSRLRNAYRAQSQFNRTCGTSFIIPFSAYGVPVELTVSADQAEVAAAFDERLPNILGAHRNAVDWHAAHGRSLAPLPFRGAVYHVDTGENHSGKALVGLARPLSAEIAVEFGITRTRGAISTLWACFGVVAAWQTTRLTLRRAVASVSRRVRRDGS